MTRFLWLCWDGGGNLNPSLGIARALRDRGHSVTFVGRPEMISRVTAAGHPTIELRTTRTFLEKYPPSPIRPIGAYLTSPSVQSEIMDVVRTERPDVVIIDGMFPAALAGARDYGCPTAVMCHTFFYRMINEWRAMLEKLNAMRQQAGFSPLPGLDSLWMEPDALVVNTLEELDTPVTKVIGNVRHSGPILEQETRAVPVVLPWSATDPRPLVLVSFSTVTEQRMLDNWQRTLQALEPLPVRVLGTTGGLVDPEELKIPQNAHVVKFASHDAVMPIANLVVTHGGHGTAMRALSFGLPMVLMPALAADQPIVAAAVEAWGAGRALPTDASVEQIRESAISILESPRFASSAKQIAAKLQAVDGARAAAVILEDLKK